MADLNDRLLTYIHRDIFMKRWRLDGASPDAAFLGKGTYGRVYAVICEEQDAATGRRFRQTAALKIIPIDESEVPNATQTKLYGERRKVEREIAIMEKVRGTTNIAYFLDSRIIDRSDTQLHSWDVLILMDKLISLQRYLDQVEHKPGTSEYLVEVLHIWRDISTALRTCENVSIIHADVKRANVLYSPGREAFVLSDFGEAIPASTYEPGKPSRGTYDYMAPEMYHQQGGDSRMDMYSLAVMIYELLNGNRLPLQQGPSRREAYTLRLEEKKSIPPIKGVPSDVNAALLRCMEYDPARRFASCKELEDTVLDLYVKYRRGGAAPGRGSNRLVKPLLVGASVLLLAGAGLVVLLNRPRPEPVQEPEQIEALAVVPPTDAPPTATVTPTVEPATPTPTATPTATPTPTPTPTATATAEATPVPSLELRLSERQVAAEAGEVALQGSVYVDGEVPADALRLSVNGSYVSSVSWTPVDGGYDFTTALRMDLQGVDELDVRAFVQGASGIEAAQVLLPVVAPEPSPESKPASEGAGEAALAPIAVSEREALAERRLGAGESLTLTGSAQPDEALDVEVNGESIGNFVVESDGSFGVDVSSAQLAAGINQITLNYSRIGRADTQVDLSVVCDLEAPEIEAVERIDQFTGEITVRIANEDADCLVELWVDGALVQTQSTAGGSATLTGVDALGLTAGSAIELVATDAAGNASRRSVAFERSLTGIAVTNRTELQEAPIGAQGAQLHISALPNATLRALVGERSREIATDADGAGSLPLDGELLGEGENAVAIEYAEVDGAEVAQDARQRVELTVRYDSVAPEFEVEPDELVQGERALRLRATNEDSWRAALWVDGACVSQLGFIRGGDDCRIEIPGGVELSRDSSIRAVVTDAAGNEAEREIGYFSVEPISIENSGALSQPVGLEDDATLRLRGEPGAAIRLWVDDASYEGSLADWDVRQLLHAGENHIRLEYAESNGYPERALANTAAELTVYLDDAQPQVSVEPEVITRDTERLVVRVPNEPNGYSLALDVDGRRVWSREQIMEEEVAIEGLDGFGLPGSSEVVLTAADGVNAPASHPLHFENTSERLDAYASAAADIDPVCIGGDAALDAVVFANRADMESADGCGLYLLGANGSERSVSFEARALDAAEARALRDGLDVALNEGYADRAYALTSFAVPEDLPGGEYRLELRIQTPYERCDFELGSVTVLGHNAYAEESDATYNAAAGATIELGNRLVAGAGDVEGGRYQLWLVGEDGASLACSAELSALGDDARRELLASAGGSLNAEYADRAYAVQSVTLPSDCPGGSYSLVLRLQTEGEERSFRLCGIDVMMMEAYAGVDGGIPSAAPGETVAIDGWVLCSSYDFNSEQRRLQLIDAEGNARDCAFTKEDLDGARRGQLAASLPVELDTEYADIGYALTSLTIPANCAPGAYQLALRIETEHHLGEESYSFPLGSVTVTEAAQSSSAGEDYVDEAQGYAIGIDPPLQAAFRADNIVLTGWVYHAEGTSAYFDHCELLDSIGRIIDKNFLSEEDGELARLQRDDFESHSHGMSGGTAENAGFVIRFDASDARVTSGQAYTLRLYSSNEQGEGWETLSITVQIDDSAPEITQSDIDAITATWAPAPPPEEPQEE